MDDQNDPLRLKPVEDPLCNMYEELGPSFEKKLLMVATHFAETELQLENDKTSEGTSSLSLHGKKIDVPYLVLCSYSTMVQIDDKEVQKWREAYAKDSHFSLVLDSMRKDEGVSLTFPQYHGSAEGLIYFEDSMGNTRLCVPKEFHVEVMQETHNTITEAAHGGYFKTYNWISSTYYWPRMSREVKVFVNTCDICQKTKPRRHGPVGLLQPIPIPSQPFEVVSMDFIPELPVSDGFDNILVIVDKLTKYAILIPTTT